ncbi:MAG: polyprenyl synthetase family protein [Chthoniobacterales bacterium]
MKSLTKWAARPIPAQATKAFDASMTLIAGELSSVEKKISEQAACFNPEVQKYIAYACGGSGKRLRPVLALLSGGATGEITAEHLQLALILELIHIATLVHDDIMDEAKLRRGKPTLHAQWGNSVSVLVGDILFSHALKMAADFSDSAVCRRIADAVLEVCSGEILQTKHRFDLALNFSDYYRIVQMKTGALFSVACELGAFLNKDDVATSEVFKNYGNNIGVAYQILDDCIDLVGNQEKIGKTLGTDLHGGKFTLPILMLLESVSKADREKIEELLLSNQKKDIDALIIKAVEEGPLASAVKEAVKLLDEANASLEKVGPNKYVTGLYGVSSYLRGVLETLAC